MEKAILTFSQIGLDNGEYHTLPGSRSKVKIALLDVFLIVENNNKFVRGKKKARESIEDDWKYHYRMNKLEIDGWDYILKVPYDSMDALEEIVYEIMSEAESTAEYKNCYVEINISHKESDQHW